MDSGDPKTYIIMWNIDIENFDRIQCFHYLTVVERKMMENMLKISNGLQTINITYNSHVAHIFKKCLKSSKENIDMLIILKNRKTIDNFRLNAAGCF